MEPGRNAGLRSGLRSGRFFTKGRPTGGLAGTASCPFRASAYSSSRLLLFCSLRARSEVNSKREEAKPGTSRAAWLAFFADRATSGHFAAAGAAYPGAAMKVNSVDPSSAFQIRISPSQLPVASFFVAGFQARQ